MKQTLETRQLRDHLDELIPAGGVARFQDKAALDEIAAELEADDEETSGALDALGRLGRDEDLTPDDRAAVEAIILPYARPVIDIAHDAYEAPTGRWSILGNADVRRRVEAAIPSVGRIELPGDPRLEFVGTGFVVGPDLMMTNRHVAEVFADGLGRQDLVFRPGSIAVSDFREELVPSPSIQVRVLRVEMIHPFFDMALLRVDRLPEEQRPLSLGTEHPEELADRDVAIIGHPAFDARNPVGHQNRIFRAQFDKKRLQPGTLTGRRFVRSYENRVHALTHNASTLGGNSGSVVLDLESGHAVGLHFAGRYKVANYAVSTHDLARDPYVREAGLRWAGAIPDTTGDWMDTWKGVDGGATPNGTTPKPTTSVAVTSSTADGETTITLPLQIRVSLGTPSGGGDVTIVSPSTRRDRQAIVDSGLRGPVTEAPSTKPDPDYSNREGYDRDFLEGYSIRLPWLTDEQYADTARNMEATRQRHVLPYHHFSVVMSKSRRLAYFTAVNIDGLKYWHIERDEFDDSWDVDPRIPRSQQLENEYYKKSGGVDNPLDRGHLVRRLDPCWGATWDEVVDAHHDTFHYTNASPQHSSFNRRSNVWLGIEDYILKKAAKRDLRVSVFTGPVLDPDDPVYDTPAGVRLKLPTAYWKVVSTVDSTGQLFVTAYVLSQEHLVDDLVEAAPYGSFKTYQTSVADVAALTGLWFWGLEEYDPLHSDLEAAAPMRIELGSTEDIVAWRDVRLMAVPRRRTEEPQAPPKKRKKKKGATRGRKSND